MTDLFLERDFDPPMTVEDVQEMSRQSRGCFGLHHVTWRASMLSLDGRKMLCRFQAPDAESARIALRTLNADITNLWPGTVHDAPGTTAADQALANVLVERGFDEPVTLESVQALEDAGAGCLATHRVAFLRTFFSADQKRMICLYRAPDAESVRLAQREAGMPVERVWAFTVVRPVE